MGFTSDADIIIVGRQSTIDTIRQIIEVGSGNEDTLVDEKWKDIVNAFKEAYSDFVIARTEDERLALGSYDNRNGGDWLDVMCKLAIAFPDINVYYRDVADDGHCYDRTNDVERKYFHEGEVVRDPIGYKRQRNAWLVRVANEGISADEVGEIHPAILDYVKRLDDETDGTKFIASLYTPEGRATLSKIYHDEIICEIIDDFNYYKLPGVEYFNGDERLMKIALKTFLCVSLMHYWQANKEKFSDAEKLVATLDRNFQDTRADYKCTINLRFIPIEKPYYPKDELPF